MKSKADHIRRLARAGNLGVAPDVEIELMLREFQAAIYRKLELISQLTANRQGDRGENRKEPRAAEKSI